MAAVECTHHPITTSDPDLVAAAVAAEVATIIVLSEEEGAIDIRVRRGMLLP